MLLQFSFENFLSFREKAVFDMTAVNSYKEHEYNLMETNSSEKVNKVAVVYGANASGKSNFFKALNTFSRIVIESKNTKTNEDKTIKKYYKPYSFCEHKRNTEFEIILAIEDYEYKYGFIYNSEYITTEWLYRKSYLTNKTSMLLERSDDEITFGASIKGTFNKYEKLITRDTLVMSFFGEVKLEDKDFYTVFKIIKNITCFDNQEMLDESVTKAIVGLELSLYKKELMDFLKSIDSDIIDIKVEKNGEDRVVKTIHENLNNEKYNLDLFEESDGTLKSFTLFFLFKRIIENKGVLLIDEFNSKLHPLLLKLFINMFNDEKSKGQLIYTSHDTTWLDKKYVRRDQVWFVNKDKKYSSKLYSLADYKPRKDGSFQEEYLSGVYNAIPFLKNFSFKEEK